MASLKAHFDGRSIILDEPATLAVGQTVRVIVDPDPTVEVTEAARRGDDALAASAVTDDELAEWLEVETHAMRGVPYPPE
jgi:hypothetical protein